MTMWRQGARVGVIGGGPAGSAIALRLAEMGHAVVLLEAARFPRHHVGEALPAPVLSLLESFGLRDRVEHCDVFRTRVSCARWDSDTPVTRAQSGVPGLQVNRAAFDALLLRAAADAGVSVLQPVRSGPPKRGADGRWTLPCRSGAQEWDVRVDFVIDATGRRGVMSKTKCADGHPTEALYGYWRGESLPQAATLIDTLPGAWLWGTAIPGAGFNTMVFTDRKDRVGRTYEERRRLYLDLLQAAPLFRDCTKGQLVSPVRRCDASAFHREEVAGANFLKVGEAAFALDPLSSQGVLAALTSALHGSLVVNTLLAENGDGDAAIQFYKDRVAEAVARNRQTTAARYRAHPQAASSPFWLCRGIAQDVPGPKALSRATASGPIDPDQPLQLADGVRIAHLPAVTGQRISRTPAITHPDWDRPVAFLRDLPVGRILAEMPPGQSCRALIAKWSKRYDPHLCVSGVSWLCEHGVLMRQRT